ncbi:MAG: 3-hydroxyacyl-ACP dehydratase [Chitinophagaceae bacterium]
MLLDSLYTIISLEHRSGLIQADLELNEDHEIFQGHFPGQPVLPGACMLQMIKEILQKEIFISLKLKKAGVIKFLEMITPKENKLLQINITYQQEDAIIFKINASIKSREKLCFKFNGTFEKRILPKNK